MRQEIRKPFRQTGTEITFSQFDAQLKQGCEAGVRGDVGRTERADTGEVDEPELFNVRYDQQRTWVVPRNRSLLMLWTAPPAGI